MLTQVCWKIGGWINFTENILNFTLLKKSAFWLKCQHFGWTFTVFFFLRVLLMISYHALVSGKGNGGRWTRNRSSHEPMLTQFTKTYISHDSMITSNNSVPKSRPESVRTYELLGKWFCWKDLKYSVYLGTIVYIISFVYSCWYIWLNYVHTVHAGASQTNSVWNDK